MTVTRSSVLLRTRTGVKPLYVSVGHRVGLETAIELVLATTTRYRLLETTRAAHALASGCPNRCRHAKGPASRRSLVSML